MISENNYPNQVIPMSKAIIGNISYLKRLSQVITAGESKDRVDTLISLYTSRKITQSSTVENVIVAYIKSTNAKQRVAVHKKNDKIMDKYKDAKPISARLSDRKGEKIVKVAKNKSANKIQKLFRGTIKFKSKIVARAHQDKVLTVEVKSASIGSAVSYDVIAFLAKAYLNARKYIPKDAVFQIWASCNFDFETVEAIKNTSRETEKYASNNIKGFFNEFSAKLGLEYGAIILSTLVFRFSFIIIPAGAGCGTTDRSLESIFMKKSVIKVINTDNNCFWYAMAMLMNPDKAMIKDHRYPKTRIDYGSKICNKSYCEWDKPVSFLQIPLVEEKFNCNIYVINVNNIPILGASISLLMNCLMYKSLNRNREQYYLLYDEVKKHYDCITDKKVFRR
jgi:hypothetical protein